MPDSASGTMVRCRECFKPFTALAISSPAEPPTAGAASPDERVEPAGAGPEIGLTEAGVDLRPVVARLVDIQRKCSALSAQRKEVGELIPVLDALIQTLRVGHGPRGEAVSLREAAVPIGAWGRRLERLGLPALGREVAHAEKTLAAADDAGAAHRRAEMATARPADAVAVPPAPRAPTPIPAPLSAPPRRRRGLWGALVAAALVAVVAVIAGFLLLRPPPRSTGTADTTFAAPTPVEERPAVRPSPTLGPEDSAPTQLSPGAIRELAEAVSQARLALQRGDLEAAIALLSRAALVDRSRPEVRGAAVEVVAGLVARSNQQVEAQDWDRADATLERALELSQRFALDTGSVDERLQRIRTEERTVRVRPTELDRLRAARGRQVEVRLRDRDALEAVLSSVDEQLLVLEVRDKVGAGEVTYTRRVPLATVEWVQYRYRP
jgi:hypothetical protein